MGNKHRDLILTSYDRRKIFPRSDNQEHYVSTVQSHDVTFCFGVGGSGKSYLSIACAVAALKRKDVNRIILCRPAITAGEDHGFLPGDLTEKVDPYLRPLYDALDEMIHPDQLKTMLQDGTIEVAPLGFMRGRSIKNSFLILDEAQNTTTTQMRMFLTRLDRGSRAVISGDLTQTDLRRNQVSGLEEAYDALEGVRGIGFAELEACDIERHPLVKKMVSAYDLFDNHSLDPGD